MVHTLVWCGNGPITSVEPCLLGELPASPDETGTFWVPSLELYGVRGTFPATCILVATVEQRGEELGGEVGFLSTWLDYLL